jgi:hypothetical protein
MTRKMIKAPKRPVFEDDGIATPKQPSKHIKRGDLAAAAESANEDKWSTLITQNELSYKEVEALYLHQDGITFRDDVPTNIDGDPIWRVALREGSLGFFIQDLKRICRKVYKLNREADYLLHHYLPSMAVLKGFKLVTKHGDSLKQLYPTLPPEVKQELRAVLGNNRFEEIDWSLYKL